MLAKLFGGRSIELAADGQVRATIVASAATQEAAAGLQSRLLELTKVKFPIVLDEQVLEEGAFRYKKQWQDKTLILLGNVDTNRAFLRLYSRFMVGANSAYPGAGLYVLRMLFEPLHAGADVVVIGGSDEQGLAAGVARLAALVSASIDEQGNCRLQPLIEFGDATGHKPQNAGKVGRSFTGRAYAFFWYADASAGQWVKQYLIDELAKAGPGLGEVSSGGHYKWEGNYRALLQVLASGLLTAEQTAQVADRMCLMLTVSEDGFGRRVILSTPGSFQSRCTRHMISALSGQLLLADYLHNIAPLDPVRKQLIARAHASLNAILRSFAQTGRFRGGLEGREGINVMDNLANLIFYDGDEAAMTSGVFRHMAAYKIACRDNLGCETGIDSYIGCRPGMQVMRTGTGSLGQAMEIWLRKDRQQLWLSKNLGGGFGYLSVAFPPHFASPEPTLEPVFPESFLGVQVVPLDGYLAGLATTYAHAESLTKTSVAGGAAFDKAVFRDGFDPDDAYLLLQGANISAPMWREGVQGNAIVRYTELGSLWFFQNTQIQGSWARSIVRVSRGEHDPQSSACVNTASFGSKTVSAMQSLQGHNGGTAWRRTILRRHGGYFIVADELTAHHNDDYNLTCQWRCYQPGRFVDERRFVAFDANKGTRMNIVSARPYANSVEQRDRDGSTDPLFARQFQNLQMTKGQAATFLNLVYTTGGTAERDFEVRQTVSGSAIIKGKTDKFDELALVSTAPLEDVAGIDADAKIAYLSQDLLCFVGVKRVSWPGVTVEADVSFNLEITAGRAGIIENPTDKPMALRLSIAGSGSARPLPSGKHELTELAGTPVGDQLALELDRRWELAEPPPEQSPGPATIVKADSSAWGTEVFGLTPRLYHRIGLSVEAENAVDINMLLDRDHHRWSPATSVLCKSDWTMDFDLGSPVDVHSIRFVGPRGTYVFPQGLLFDVEIDVDPTGAVARRIESIEPAIEKWYSEMEQYMATSAHAALRIPVNARASKVRLEAKVGESTAPSIEPQEVQVFVRDPTSRIPVSLAAIDDAQGPGIIAVGHDEVARLDLEGNIKWRWKADSKIISSFVEFAENEKAWLIGVWPVSNRFALLDTAGNLTLDPEVYGNDPDSNSAALFSGYSRPGAVMLWEREKDKPGRIAYFPHVALIEINRTDDGLRVETAQTTGYQGGKAAIRIPDVTGDGSEDLFVVGRYENLNGVLASEFHKKGDSPAVTKWWRTEGWTGWSAGNMELPMYHVASKVMRQDANGTQWLGVVALNPGGIDYYQRPALKRAWGHFNHPGNLCHAVGDVTGDGVDEIVVGKEDGFVIIYDALTGKQIAKRNLRGEVRAVCITDGRIIAGTSTGLTVMTRDGQAVIEVQGAVESIVVSGTTQIIVGFSDGWIRRYDL